MKPHTQKKPRYTATAVFSKQAQARQHIPTEFLETIDSCAKKIPEKNNDSLCDFVICQAKIELREAFEAADKNGDGILSADEYHDIFQSHGLAIGKRITFNALPQFHEIIKTCNCSLSEKTLGVFLYRGQGKLENMNIS